MTDTAHDEAFWLDGLEEAFAPPKLTSNKARPGDADYKSPLPTPGHGLPKTPKPKKLQQGPTGRKTAHKGTGPGGGQFVSSDSGNAGAEQAAVQTALSPADQSGMKASIMAFQKKHGLQVDGVVGRQTALALSGRYTEARSTAVGKIGKREGALLVARHQPAARRARVRARRQQRAAGGVVAEDDRHGAFLAEEPVGFFDAKKHPKDALGKWAKKLFPGGDSAHGLIPEYDPKGLTFGKGAGGSNGARTAKHVDGSTWLVKSYGGNEDRVATELLSNAAYRHMGAKVPRAGRIRLLNGKQALSYPFLDGKPQPMVFQGRRDNRSAELGQHFMMDALLGNWDVAGLEDDNILWNKAGEPFRVDQGGTLEFRAMGGKKFFGPVPMEVSSMLSPKGQAARSMAVTEAGLRQQARDIGVHMGPGVVDSLVDGAGFQDHKMRERVRTHLKARVEWMRRFGAGEVGWPVQEGWVEEAVLQEAAQPLNFFWDPHLHPREAHGKFVKTIFGLGTASSGAKKVNLDAKTSVSKDKDGSFRVVRSGQIIKGFTSPADAARAALDRSVKGKDEGSVGGMQSYKDFNAYLKARGLGDVDKHTSPHEPVLFGGEALTASQAVSVHADLTQRMAIAREQGKTDKYVQRAVPTLEARHAELTAKLKGAGTKPSVLPAGAKTANDIAAQSKVDPGVAQAATLVSGVMKDLVALPSGATKQLPGDVKVWKKPNGGGYHVFGGPENGVAGQHYEDAGNAAHAAVKHSVEKLGSQVQTATAAPGVKVGDKIPKDKFVKGMVLHSPSGQDWVVTDAGVEHVMGDVKHPFSALNNETKWEVKALPGGAQVPTHTVADSPGLQAFGHNVVPGMFFKHAGNEQLWFVKGVSPGGTVMVNKPPDQAQLSNDVPYTKETVKTLIGDGSWVRHLASGGPVPEQHGFKVAGGGPKGGQEGTLAADVYKQATAPKSPVKKVGKNAKQANTLGEGGTPAKLNDLHLEPGDKVQHKPGGYVYTYKGPTSSGIGHIFVHEPTGKQKHWAGFSKPLNVIKADQSELMKKEPGMEASTPPAPAPKTELPNISTMKVALSKPSGSHPLLSQLHDGDVVQTPAGDLVVMKPSEAAYQGYVSAYNIQTGVKVEVPGGKPPTAYSQTAAMKDAAAQHLANAKASTSVSAASASTGKEYVAPAKLKTGPPDSFTAAAAWQNAKPHIPSAASTGLTSEETSAIKSYTGSGYGEINAALRDSKSVKDLHVAKKAAAIKKALAKSVVKQDVWIGRKTDNQEWKNNATAGTVIADNGVISTSINPNSWSGAISLNILVRKGANALYVDPISNHKGEEEVLLPPGSHFHVLKREESATGQLTLYVEML